ncbi:MAG: hypothetical protein H0V38_04460 [Sporichthyaceae bacterium]|nr:hypothetical protein [Sporichthyaceae bacterium]
MSNRKPDVDTWFDRYDNPQNPLVLAVRMRLLECGALCVEVRGVDEAGDPRRVPLKPVSRGG